MTWLKWLLALLCVGTGCGPAGTGTDGDLGREIVFFDALGTDAGPLPCPDVDLLDSDGLIEAHWWAGDPLALGSFALTGLAPGCVLEPVDAPWLTLTLLNSTLTLSLADANQPSGARDATVVVVDAATKEARFTLTVRLSVLNAAPAAAPRHVLVFGLDGFRPDAIAAARTPHLDRLMAHGATTLLATTQLTGATRSGPGWASILTGVEVAKHGVISNETQVIKPDPDHPTFLERARLAGLAPEVIVVWIPIIGMLEPEIPARLASEEQLAALAAQSLGEGPANVLFMHFDALDHAGHASGYGGAVPEYVAALEATDARIGAILASVLARPSVVDEEWMFAVVTDHSGDGNDHGPMEPIYREIPLIFSGPRVPSMSIDGASHMDLYPTVLAFLGVEPDASWDLDGNVLFRTASATR
jgi:hypothetical protein